MIDAYKSCVEALRAIPNDGTLDIAHSLLVALRESGTRAAIVAECVSVALMLLEKNEAYSDSATNPLRIMSKASPEEQILVRIDDKLARIAKGDPSFGDEDTVLDLIGYLVLLRVLQKGGAS